MRSLLFVLLFSVFALAQIPFNSYSIVNSENSVASILVGDVGDMDGDGDYDIVALTTNTTNSGVMLDLYEQKDSLSYYPKLLSQLDNVTPFSLKISPSPVSNNRLICILGTANLENLVLTFEINTDMEVLSVDTAIINYNEALENAALVDFDHDGLIDILYADTNIYLLHNEGNNQFTDTMLVSSMPTAFDDYMFHQVYPIDIDNDSDLDMVAHTSMGDLEDEIFILINDGNNNFSPNLIYTNDPRGFSSQKITPFLFGDINNDNIIDLVINGYYVYQDDFDLTEYIQNQIEILTSNGDLTYSKSVIGRNLPDFKSYGFFDYDSDGDNDLITFGDDFTSGSNYFFNNNGNTLDTLYQIIPEFQIHGALFYYAPTIQVNLCMAVGRLNYQPTFNLINFTGQSSYQFVPFHNFFMEPRNPVCADFNHDQITDMAIADGNYAIHLLKFQDPENFTDSLLTPNAIDGGIEVVLSAVDLDQNNHEDIMVFQYGAPIKVFMNEGNFNFQERTINIIGNLKKTGFFKTMDFSASPDSPIPVDLDQNGLTDFLYPQNGQLYYYQTQSDTFTMSQSSLDDSLSNLEGVYDLKVVDWQDDGDPDIILYGHKWPSDPNTAIMDNVLLLYTNNGNMDFTVDTLATFPIHYLYSKMSLQIIDYNQDQYPDIIMNADSSLFIYQNQSYTSFSLDTLFYDTTGIINQFRISDINSDDLYDITISELSGVTGGSSGGFEKGTSQQVKPGPVVTGNLRLVNLLQNNDGSFQKEIVSENVADIDVNYGYPLFDFNSYDFDLDGYPDIVFQRVLNGISEIGWYKNDYRALAIPGGTGQEPDHFELMQNYPNPFNPVTHINYVVAKRTHIKLRVYNALGQLVKELVNEVQNPGYYSINFNASSLPSGIYFYQLNAGETVLTKKMLLVK